MFSSSATVPYRWSSWQPLCHHRKILTPFMFTVPCAGITNKIDRTLHHSRQYLVSEEDLTASKKTLNKCTRNISVLKEKGNSGIYSKKWHTLDGWVHIVIRPWKFATRSARGQDRGDHSMNWTKSRGESVQLAMSLQWSSIAISADVISESTSMLLKQRSIILLVHMLIEWFCAGYDYTAKYNRVETDLCNVQRTTCKK